MSAWFLDDTPATFETPEPGHRQQSPSHNDEKQKKEEKQENKLGKLRNHLTTFLYDCKIFFLRFFRNLLLFLCSKESKGPHQKNQLFLFFDPH